MTLLSSKSYIFIFFLKFLTLSSFIYGSDLEDNSIDEMRTLSKHDLRQKLRDEYDKNKHLQEELERVSTALLKAKKERNHQQKRHHHYKEECIKLRKEEKIKKKRRKTGVVQSKTVPTNVKPSTQERRQSHTPIIPITRPYDATGRSVPVETEPPRAIDQSYEEAKSPIRPIFDHWSSFNR